MKRILNALGKRNWGKRAYAVFALCATTAIALPAQTFTTLFTFDYTDGQNPQAALVQGTDGNLYGTTMWGGANGDGTLFRITPGTLTTLHSFAGYPVDGSTPLAGLVQAINGDLYGTTEHGGANCADKYGCGTVFEITPSGTLTTLYSFAGSPTDGALPSATLVQAANGDFYGTTEYGGAHKNCNTAGCGTIFKITPSGRQTTLYSFCAQSGCPDGALPYAGLVQATSGDFYGTTPNGGFGADYGYGTIFEITPGGTLTTLYRFCSQSSCPDGANPVGGLVQATNGYLYGTTAWGGAYGYGTVFKITPSGILTTLYSFCSQGSIYCTDGANPFAGLVQANDGNLYGVTNNGGTYGGPGGIGGGTFFKIIPAGTLTTLLSLPPSGYGFPYGGLLQATNGDFYGTTSPDFEDDYGTVFSVSVGLPPFVETRPTSGKMGAFVEILGTNLTGATSVSFHGTAAGFKVVSSSLIATTVPAGATSGTVEVVTPSGTLSSNVRFRVLP